MVIKKVGLGEASRRGVGTGANQIPDMSSFGGMAGPAGLMIIPGVGRNRIIQWGRTFSATNNTINTVNLPNAFPNNFYQIVLTHDDASSVGSMAFAAATPINLSSFSAAVQKLEFNATTGAVNMRTVIQPCAMRFIAIGD